MNANAGVARAGTACDKANARLPGQLAISLRHVGRACFVPRYDSADFIAGAGERIDGSQETFARKAEDSIDAVDFQSVNENLSAAAAYVRTCCSENPSSPTTSVTSGSPSVSVPVLSITTVSTLLIS